MSLEFVSEISILQIVTNSDFPEILNYRIDDFNATMDRLTMDFSNINNLGDDTDSSSTSTASGKSSKTHPSTILIKVLYKFQQLANLSVQETI